MPATFNEIGVAAVTGALVESVEVTKQLEHKIIKRSDGTFETGHKYDPMFEFSVKGRGSVTASTLLGASGGAYQPDVISGGVTIVTNVKLSETNEDFNSFEISGVNYPGASASGT